MPRPPHRTLYELGRGGMGVVELAEAEPGARLVAVKRILPYRADDARTRSAFLREARLLARIDHPNVVRALAVDEGGGGDPPALVMNYVAGVPLKELLAASPGGLPVPVAARLALDVARGLHAAHELRDAAGALLGVVHRDVSPHNVLVTFDGGAVLLDFGVAKVNDATRTLTGEVKGKLAYMAPEQAMADPVDRRSDLYALGALLYEMLTGRRMHGEGTDLEILKRMASERPAPVAALRGETPPPLARLVARMTDESPARRPADASEVAAALEPFAAGASGVEVAAYVERTLPGARRRHDERLAEARQTAAPAPRPSAAVWPFKATRAHGVPRAGDEAALPPPASGPPTLPPPGAEGRPSSRAADERPVPPLAGAAAGSRANAAAAAGRGTEAAGAGANGAAAGPRASETPAGPHAAAARRSEATDAAAPVRAPAPRPLGRARTLALGLVGASLVLALIGGYGLVAERRRADGASATPSSFVATPDAPPAANASGAPASLSEASGATSAAEVPSPTPPPVARADDVAGAAAPFAAPPPRRIRLPARRPSPAPSAATPAPGRPPPPALPVDTKAIGDDDR